MPIYGNVSEHAEWGGRIHFARLEGRTQFSITLFKVFYDFLPEKNLKIWQPYVKLV